MKWRVWRRGGRVVSAVEASVREREASREGMRGWKVQVRGGV